MILLRLFWEFFKIGLFSVGGGMATLPFLYDLPAKTGWFTEAELTNMLAVSESTPGPIGINMATYAGFTTGGIPGAVIASVAVILPGFLFVLLVAAALRKFRNNRYVTGVLNGLRPASVGLITAAGLLVAKLCFISTDNGLSVSWKALALAAVLLILTRWVKPTKDLHPVVFIAFSAVVGIVFSFGN